MKLFLLALVLIVPFKQKDFQKIPPQPTCMPDDQACIADWCNKSKQCLVNN